MYRTHRTARHVHVLRQRLDILSVYRSVYHGIAESKRGEGAPSLFIDPLQQRQPLGEKGLGFGVMQPAFAVGAVHQLLRQCGGGSVDSHHVLHGQLQGERRRNIRQRRQRVLPHKGRQQLHRHGQAGALLGQQQCGGGCHPAAPVGCYIKSCIRAGESSRVKPSAGAAASCRYPAASSR